MNPYDIYICSDGSGYLDHWGGYAAIVRSSRFKECNRVTSCGCSTHMETGRAEFTAVLAALHSIMETMEWDRNKNYREYLTRNKVRVLVISDREDLVGGINGIFRREANLDLWAQYAWYTQYFDIVATHVKRETHPLQTKADVLASEMRIVLRDFIHTQDEIGNIDK